MEELTVRYGNRTAIDRATWRAAAGQITVIMGANGAGKSSTLRVAVGLLAPTAGSVRVLGLDPRDRALRPRVGVMLPAGGFYPSSTARRSLSVLAAQYASPQPIAELATFVGLTHLDTPYRRMSSGEQRKLALAAALVGRPELVIADEPTSGLDPTARHHVWTLFNQLRARGVSVVTTTHPGQEAEALADHVVMYHDGRVVADGTLEELLRGSETLRFTAGAGIDLAGLRAALPEHCEVIEEQPGRYIVSPGSEAQVAATVTAWCVQHGVAPRELHVGRRDLESVYFEVTDVA